MLRASLQRAAPRLGAKFSGVPQAVWVAADVLLEEDAGTAEEAGVGCIFRGGAGHHE